jgi:stearoyl-CoA desaturase (delta-9 desaturase)
MAIISFFVGHWYLSLFCQTFFLHRYAAHRMFSMNKFWEKYFYFLTFISQGSSFLSPYVYGALHRLHHIYADKEGDPHSPKFSQNIFDMMWKTRKIYNEILHNKFQVDSKYLKELPNWKFMERFGDSIWVRLSWGAFYSLYYIYFATEWWMYLLLPIHYVMGPVHGAVINWFAHKIGYTNFKVSDTSKNMVNIDILMFGEGLHNNHHSHASSPNFAQKWWEFDPAYPIIKVLSWLRIIKLRGQQQIAELLENPKEETEKINTK